MVFGLMSLGPGTQSLGLGLETQKYLDLGLENMSLDISGHIVLYCITIVYSVSQKNPPEVI